jgi:hypothetical protein
MYFEEFRLVQVGVRKDVDDSTGFIREECGFDKHLLVSVPDLTLQK